MTSSTPLPVFDHNVVFDRSWLYYGLGYAVKLINEVPGVNIELKQDVSFIGSSAKAILENTNVTAAHDLHRPLIEISVEKRLWDALIRHEVGLKTELGEYAARRKFAIVIDELEMFIVITQQRGSIVPLQDSLSGFYVETTSS